MVAEKNGMKNIGYRQREGRTDVNQYTPLFFEGRYKNIEHAVHFEEKTLTSYKTAIYSPRPVGILSFQLRKLAKSR